jgi:hypothetical protein
MFGDLFSKRSIGSPMAGFDLPAVRRLQAALAALPPEWQALRSRRARGTDGPPWVKFIVLHPEKGIALIDLLPADPGIAIEPLDEFLARTRFEAFSQGDPPIVAVALDEGDIDAIERHLVDAFTTAPSCGIKNANWTEAVVELLISTPGLLLTRIARVSDASMRGMDAAPRDRQEAEPSIVPLAPPEPREVRAIAEPDPDFLDDGPIDFAGKRPVWIVPAVLAASLVLGAIGLVYADWPKALPAAIAEAEHVPRQENDPSRLPADFAAGQAPASAASFAAVTVPPAPRKPKGQATLAARPVWEEARSSHRKAAKAPAAVAAERKQKTHEDFLTALNNWLSSR